MNDTQKLSKWIQLFKSAILEHYNVFFNGFDPIKDSFQFRSKGNPSGKPLLTVNGHFVLPFTILVITVVQGLIGFDDGTESNLPFSESKRFVTHQVFPKQFWIFTDILVLFSIFAISTLYLTLTLTPMLDSQCFLYFNSNKNRSFIDRDQILSSQESQKVRPFRTAARRTIKLIMLIWILSIQLYFIRQLLGNEHMVVTRRSIFYWTVLIPVFLTYVVFVEMVLVVYFVLTCKYIQIRQQTILDRFEWLKLRTETFLMEAVNSNSNKPETKPKKTSTKKPLPNFIYREFLHLNRHSLRICRYITLSNAFWSRYLTVYFIMYTFFLCYSVYIILLGSANLSQKSLFFLVLDYSALQLLLIIKQCGNIVRNNARITRSNFYFYQLFQNGDDAIMMQRKSARSVLKAENLTCALWEKNSDENSNALYGYRLLNDYRIDFGTFYYAFYNMSVFFMLNFRT